METRSLLFVDPPDHTRLRTLVTKAFAARFPRLRLDDEPPRWREGFVPRGPASLPLSLA